MKVYEMIQELAKYPAEMQVAINIIGENISPLNNHDNGTIDLDNFELRPLLNVIPTRAGGVSCVRIEVELT